MDASPASTSRNSVSAPLRPWLASVGFQHDGAYEGLTAIWEEVFDSDTCSSGIRGVIFAGEPPGAAEPYVSE
jgi:hypothetical protein